MDFRRVGYPRYNQPLRIRRDGPIAYATEGLGFGVTKGVLREERCARGNQEFLTQRIQSHVGTDCLAALEPTLLLAYGAPPSGRLPTSRSR
jgi:hypothetical protein